MNLTNVSSEVETAEFKLNGEWEMTSTVAAWNEVVLPCCQDIRYSKVVFTLILHRRYTFYVMNIVMPCKQSCKLVSSSHVAKLGEITGKTRVLYSKFGEITGKTRVLPCGL